MTRGRQALALLLLAGFGMALSLLVLEVGVRALHLVPTRFWEPDALLGTRLIANKEGWWTQEDHEFVVPIRINSQRRRDVEPDAAKPADVFRVLVLGDSFIEALQVPLEDTFSRQLEAALEAAMGKGAVRVSSMGVSGYGTASQTLYYEQTGRELDPDVVLLAFYPGNDVRNNSPALEPLLRPVYGSDGALERVAMVGKEDTRMQADRGILWRLQSYQYARKILLTKQPRLAALLADLGLLKRQAVRDTATNAEVPIDYGVFAANPSAEWEEAWKHTERLLARLSRDVENDGGRFAIVIVTARDHVYPDAWARVLDANPTMREREWDLDAPELRVVEWCKEKAIPCIRLSPTFVAHAKQGEPLHFTYDGHWTPKGHALAARTVAASLEQAGLLKPTLTEER
jgi:lysophospholipase L1-like esterase